MKTTRILILLLAIALASCKSSKNAENSTTSVTTPTTTITTPGKQQQDNTSITNFTAKVHANINIDGKDVTCPGNLRMRRGEVMQLSISDPIVGISEIMRLEVSPSDILLIDRINKQYMQVTKEEIRELVDQNAPHISYMVDALSYNIIENKVWNDIVDEDRNEISFDLPIKKPVKINLRLSKKNPGNANWESHTTVSPDKMRKVSPAQLIQSYSSALQ